MAGAPLGPTLGVDTGGTFTDLVLVSPGSAARFAKLSSTPAEPARAVVDGIASLAGETSGVHVVHGTTVALNALLTGRTARTALVTNAGFVDLIEIGRQDRPELYALHPQKPEPLVPRELRFEIAQRSWPSPDGRGLTHVKAPSRADLERLARRLKRAAPEAVAVCLLHSYADPEIERRVARALGSLGVPVTCSADILREHREFERFSTALVNAALAPRMKGYLEDLARALPGARLSLLQSSGGTLSAERAAAEPVRVLLSGPAGGVVGARRAAHEAGFSRLVGLDMGGTSTDVAFQGAESGEVPRTEVPRVAGHPVAVPSLDIHTIGCGGGSLVTLDAGGALHVGPESAGADPGPVCYGRSDRLTVTDAHVLLGHIASGAFVDGALPLDVDGVRRAFEKLARKLGVAPHAAAQGVLSVARAAMRRALGVMTMQRGQDPESLPLVAFGGAGGLHATALAASLRMAAALVPRGPGVLSALGMASADALRDLSESVLAPLDQTPRAERRAAFARMRTQGRRQLADEGYPSRAIEFEESLDLRYRGQSFEIRVREGRNPAESFQRSHERLYGHRLEDREIELVQLRLRAIVRRPLPAPRKARARKLPAEAVTGERRAWFETSSGTPRQARARVIDRERLAPGHRFDGPALVEEYSGTTLVPPLWNARVSAGGHLLLVPR
ncbi:MAG TPA: hydantoinase/oxoprolinase family protein [Planctomycetota bacterium]|nr:hydantoinase/oxoprolinase family protein [Planctomycetota bacterium]